MACKCAPACRALLDEATRRAPNRNRASDGCVGDAAHLAKYSDHNCNDGSGYNAAVDLTHDPANGCDAHALAEHIRVTGDPRVKYIISRRRICNPGGEWRPYTGSNPHEAHAHFSIWESARFDTSSWWKQPTSTATTTVTTVTFKEDNVKRIGITNIQLGNDGTGRVQVPGVHQDDIISVSFHDSTESHEPWPPRWKRGMNAQGAFLTLVDGRPNATYNIWIWAQGS